MIADRFGRLKPDVIVEYNGERLNGPDTNTEWEMFEDLQTRTTIIRIQTASKTLLEAMDTWR